MIDPGNFDKAFKGVAKLAMFGFAISLLIALTGGGAIIYMIYHFASKYW